MFAFLKTLIPSNLWGYAKIVGTTAIIVGVLGCVYYIDSLQDKVEYLETDNEILTMSYNQLQMNIDRLHEDIDSIKKINESFSKIQKQNQENISNLSDKFTETKTGNERDLGNLATRKPVLIQNAINKGTDKVNRCFELLTGSKLQEGETNETIRLCKEN